MVDRGCELSLDRQCQLFDVSRSSQYYAPLGESSENLALMRRLDELHLVHPFYGSRPTSPRCVQRSASSRIRSRYSALNWRRFGLATTSGSGVDPALPALGASSLRSSTPRAGRATSFNIIESLSAVIGLHLHRPTVIPKVAGVSGMLAERAGHRFDTERFVRCPVGLSIRLITWMSLSASINNCHLPYPSPKRPEK